MSDRFSVLFNGFFTNLHEMFGVIVLFSVKSWRCCLLQGMKMLNIWLRIFMITQFDSFISQHDSWPKNCLIFANLKVFCLCCKAIFIL